jgi:hypothetical protein
MIEHDAAAARWRFPGIDRRGRCWREQEADGFNKDWRRTGRMAVSHVEAWLLVLQSVLGAFASGAGPAVSQLDAFGNVICTHDGAAGFPGGDRQPAHPPACCVLGCSLASPALAAPPDAGPLLVRIDPETARIVFPVSGHRPWARGHSPSSPRAPPFAA